MSAEENIYEVEPLQPAAYYQSGEQLASAQALDQPPELTFKNIINARRMLFRAFTSRTAFREFLADERLGPHSHLMLLLLIVFVLAIIFSAIIAVI